MTIMFDFVLDECDKCGKKYDEDEFPEKYELFDKFEPDYPVPLCSACLEDY